MAPKKRPTDQVVKRNEINKITYHLVQSVAANADTAELHEQFARKGSLDSKLQFLQDSRDMLPREIVEKLWAENGIVETLQSINFNEIHKKKKAHTNLGQFRPI